MQLNIFTGYSGHHRQFHMNALNDSFTTEDGHTLQWETDGILTNGRDAGLHAKFIILRISVTNRGNDVLTENCEILKRNASSNPIDPGAELDPEKIKNQALSSLKTAINKLSCQKKQDLNKVFEKIIKP